jgi:hypothetical protein
MNNFPILILVGRPASGKSEIIDYLKRADPRDRENRFHLGTLDILDDFPMLWTWFEEDYLLEHKLGEPRLHTDQQGYFLYPYLWHLLIERFNLEYQKRLRDHPDYHEKFTTLIEFSRGSEHGGYSQAFQHLSPEILQQAVVVYVRVSYEESLRKNKRRFNPDKPDSILEHSLPDEKLEKLYRQDDWETFTSEHAEFIEIGGVRVPYAIFDNADDVTTNQPELLAERLETVLARLRIKKQR